MPGLLDLRTDLKSLKYGHDQPGDGSSRQPYIKVDINDVDNTFNRIRLNRFDDGVVRGGIVGAINASTVDTLRIGKFFADFPKGPLFLSKQVGLQLSNPRLESKSPPTDRPTTGGGFFNNVGNFISNTANRIEYTVGPTRIYNLGVNTLAQVPINALGGHILRHGLTPINDPDKLYFNIVRQNNKNGTNRLETLLNKLNSGSLDKIDDYIGGPGSVYGIGNTLIRKAEVPIDDGRLEIITNSNSGYPLVNGQRQAFTYIDLNTYNGAISSDLGQRNRFSEWNKTHYIGGVAYLNKGLTNVFYDTITNPNELVRGVDQSVYNGNYATPISIFAGLSHKTDSPEEVAFGLDRLLGASNQTGSIFAPTESSKDPLSNNDKYIPINLRNTIGSAQDKKQSFAGLSHKTDSPEEVKITSTFDYAISKTTRSSLISSPYGILTSGLNPNDSFLYKTGVEYTGSTSRKQTIPLSNNSDIVSNGPSSYPKAASGFKYQLDTPTTAYINPSAKTYTAVQTKNNLTKTRGNTGKWKSIDIDIDRNSPTYQYNVSKNSAINTFIRLNDTVVDFDDLAICFTPINPFSATDLETIKFRAYITDYTDNFNSTWGDVKYSGRAEKFYIFNEFKRDISFGFNIPCYNQEELIDQHRKLNDLASILAGTYNSNNLLGGIITKLKLGNYIDNEPGIINSLSFNIIEGSSWDLDDALAFYIKVTVGFTVIHNNIPSYKSKFFNLPPTEESLSATKLAKDIPIVGATNLSATSTQVASLSTIKPPVNPRTPGPVAYVGLIGPRMPAPTKTTS